MCSAKVAKRSPDMHQRYGNLHKDVTIHQISPLHQVNYLYIQPLDTQINEREIRKYSESCQKYVPPPISHRYFHARNAMDTVMPRYAQQRSFMEQRCYQKPII